MFYVTPYETAVTLFHVNGAVWTYRNKAEALKSLGFNWICKNVGAHFCEFSHANGIWDPTRMFCVAREPVYIGHDYVMRDDLGDPLTAKHFDELRVRRARYWARWHALMDNWNGEGPVPGIRRRRGGHYFRHPKTTRERRWAEPMPEYDEPAPRAKRSAANLPNSWDDYAIADRQDRSWKRFRGHQCKAKA